MVVFDTSAVLALMLDEPGGDVVIANLQSGVVSAVNVIEVLTRLVEAGLTIDEADAAFSGLNLLMIPLDHQLAKGAAGLRPLTRHRGLSLGDRSCLALGQHEKLSVLTADRQWEGLDIGVDIRLIR
ncbi:MAG: type II toxin-antitoxin system VapC family toxin [Blastomonas sp.]|jgi:PIN domain nuclease of toxin-antitoxin system